MLDVRKLIMLRAVAAEGSIASAARVLRYTRSAVSQQVSTLENDTGVQLIDRVGNRVSLTPAGRILVEHTERILIELRAAEATLTNDKAEVSGLLRVGVPFREGPHIMSTALTEVRHRYPNLEIRLVATTDETGVDEVQRGNLDMVLLSRVGASPSPASLGLREWILGQDALRLCVPADHRLAHADECHIPELDADAWIVCPTTALGRLTATLCQTAGFTPKVAATVNDVGTAIGLVGIGWGITIAPELTPSPPDLGIARIPIAEVRTVRRSVLIVRDGDHLSPRIAAAIAEVRAVSTRLWAAIPPGRNGHTDTRP